MKSALAGTLERARSTFSTISLGQKVVIGLLLQLVHIDARHQTPIRMISLKASTALLRTATVSSVATDASVAASM